MPKAPRNGMVIAPKTEHGMRARFKCKDGYILRGGNITKCLFGNWTGVQPYCQEGELYCLSLGLYLPNFLPNFLVSSGNLLSSRLVCVCLTYEELCIKNVIFKSIMHL